MNDGISNASPPRIVGDKLVRGEDGTSLANSHSVVCLSDDSESRGESEEDSREHLDSRRGVLEVFVK